MSTKEDKKKSYPVIEFKGKGSLILTNEILAQIFYLHSGVGNTEWSGILLYDVISGSPANPADFVLKAKHIYLMDIGSTAYTSYSFGSEVVDLFDAIPDAMDMKIGQIHSHHTMSTSFSGTDTDELMENLDKHNYYLSLIVNMAGNYTAKVAFLTTKKTKSLLSYKSDTGESLTFETEDNEEGMGVIEMKILMDYENKFFYDRYRAILAKKAAEEEAKKQKSKTVYLNESYRESYFDNSGKTSSVFPRPFAMSDKEVEKLSAYIVAVDTTLKEKNSTYTTLYNIASKNDKKSDELSLFYPKLILDNIDEIIRNFFGRSITDPEKRIVIKEVISSVRRYEKIKRLKPVIDILIPLLIGYTMPSHDMPTPEEIDLEFKGLM